MPEPDLTRSPNVGVRWQAEMEEHLAAVRERSSIVAQLSVTREAAVISTHAAVMQAHATAALALAVANSLGDIETQLARIGTFIEASI